MMNIFMIKALSKIESRVTCSCWKISTNSFNY